MVSPNYKYSFQKGVVKGVKQNILAAAVGSYR
jgi:hypothetical protein